MVVKMFLFGQDEITIRQCNNRPLSPLNNHSCKFAVNLISTRALNQCKLSNTAAFKFIHFIINSFNLEYISTFLTTGNPGREPCCIRVQTSCITLVSQRVPDDVICIWNCHIHAFQVSWNSDLRLTNILNRSQNSPQTKLQLPDFFQLQHLHAFLRLFSSLSVYV